MRALLHGAALGLAALADAGAFIQVVALLMPELAAEFVWIMVAGLTATALFLSHTTGSLFRDRREGVASAGRGVLGAVASAWLALGVTAFLVRVFADVEIGGGSTFVVDGLDVGSDPSGGISLLQALLFAALYVATGVTAACGGYMNGNHFRVAYAKARRQRTMAADRVSVSAAAHGEVEAIHNAQLTAYKGSTELLNIEKRAVLAFAEQLKQHARISVAKRCKDPAFLYELFVPDQRPYAFREFNDLDDLVGPDGDGTSADKGEDKTTAGENA